jgi:hypothetical protein
MKAQSASLGVIGGCNQPLDLIGGGDVDPDLKLTLAALVSADGYAIESLAKMADLDRRQRLILVNMVTREKRWKDLAREWNLSGARMTALKAGTKKSCGGC